VGDPLPLAMLCWWPSSRTDHSFPNRLAAVVRCHPDPPCRLPGPPCRRSRRRGETSYLPDSLRGRGSWRPSTAGACIPEG
jgi:hypothetical protein